jgi:hypothetical protein
VGARAPAFGTVYNRFLGIRAGLAELVQVAAVLALQALG